jgi:hypothetical protein
MGTALPSKTIWPHKGQSPQPSVRSHSSHSMAMMTRSISFDFAEARLSIASDHTPFAFPPFHAIVEPGLNRIFEFVKSNCFTFAVTAQMLHFPLMKGI